MIIFLTLLASFYAGVWLYLLGYNDGRRRALGKPQAGWRTVISMFAWPLYLIEAWKINRPCTPKKPYPRQGDE